MRPRTFILLFIVLVAAAAVIVLIRFRDDILGDGGAEETPAVAESPAEEQSQQPGQPAASPTPIPQFADVVVALVDIPVGEKIRGEIVRVERRPLDNVAVVAGVTFSDISELEGQIVKTAISKGQEILRPMIALNPSDLASLGSDLSLYVDQGKVAVAFPIDRFTGAAYALRPGDVVDAFMSLRLVQLDPEFQTIRPNVWERVFEPALLEGTAFLFPPTTEGRLELIPTINTVALIEPGAGREQIPRRVTQLTTQQMEVIWVGSWRNPTDSMEQEFVADAIAEPPAVPLAEGQQAPTPVPIVERAEVAPDAVILSISAQDALILKWAMETGINIDLVLRAQGDTTPFVTTSVSLPQILQQGTIIVPEPSDYGLEPRIDEVPVPELPDAPPG